VQNLAYTNGKLVGQILVTDEATSEVLVLCRFKTDEALFDFEFPHYYYPSQIYQGINEAIVAEFNQTTN